MGIEEAAQAKPGAESQSEDVRQPGDEIGVQSFAPHGAALSGRGALR